MVRFLPVQVQNLENLCLWSDLSQSRYTTLKIHNFGPIFAESSPSVGRDMERERERERDLGGEWGCGDRATFKEWFYNRVREKI